MRTPQFDAATIRDLLKAQKIATLDDMKTALGTQAPATVFRKLSELKHYTSYSHGARYYALAQIVRFDVNGLWSYDSVRFSSQGTLLATLISFVDGAEAGLYATQLKELLSVEVNMSLLRLFKQGSLSREKVHGRYLYCSADKTIAEQQIAQRQTQAAQQGTRAIVMSNDWVSDEIKAAIVLFFSLLDEQQRRLFAGLESLQFGHGGDRSIAQLLGLDPHTVAKGRRQIIERDFESEKLRKPGAGRPGVKKTPHK